MMRHSLQGHRILVTRAVDDSARWASRFAEAGAETVILPCLSFESIADDSTRATLVDAVQHTDWLLLTSPRGAEATAQLLGSERLPSTVRVGVVGPATGRVAAARLGRVDLVAMQQSAAGLAQELVALHRAGARGPRGVIATSAIATDAAPAILRSAGWEARDVVVYRTIPAAPTAPRRDLAADRIDVIVLASPSAVTGLLRVANVPTSARIVTIGPTTSQAAVAAGLTVAREANEPTFEGILEAIG
ncbi:MAG TPA: uroporphyrinogen-III synthase [Gemmatimonadales bacterium]|jgi:uroporphyrinogen-III synthase